MRWRQRIQQTIRNEKTEGQVWRPLSQQNRPRLTANKRPSPVTIGHSYKTRDNARRHARVVRVWSMFFAAICFRCFLFFCFYWLLFIQWFVALLCTIIVLLRPYFLCSLLSFAAGCATVFFSFSPFLFSSNTRAAAETVWLVCFPSGSLFTMFICDLPTHRSLWSYHFGTYSSPFSDPSSVLLSFQPADLRPFASTISSSLCRRLHRALTIHLFFIAADRRRLHKHTALVTNWQLPYEIDKLIITISEVIFQCILSRSLQPISHLPTRKHTPLKYEWWRGGCQLRQCKTDFIQFILRRLWVRSERLGLETRDYRWKKPTSYPPSVS